MSTLRELSRVCMAANGRGLATRLTVAALTDLAPRSSATFSLTKGFRLTSPSAADKRFSFSRRAAGVLLHPTSLLGRHGSGDLGVEAYRFADFLAAADQTWWQMLPVGPPGPGNSPYASFSAFAGGSLLIDLDKLVELQLLTPHEAEPVAGLRDDRVSYGDMLPYRESRLRLAFERFRQRHHGRGDEFEAFCHTQADWLENYALFAAVKRAHELRAWWTWGREIRLRRPEAVASASRELRDEVEFERWMQFEFDRQWHALRQYCHDRGVGLIGDIPIFVALDSADVWSHRELFQLDREGNPTVVSGVPPDYFSSTGQRWGHPLYRWPAHRKSGFAWWAARFRAMLRWFDAVRIDHFLGFYRCFNVPAKNQTAEHGEWTLTPGKPLLSAVEEAVGGHVEIIAENLGLVTPEAEALRKHFGYPGMIILQFAWGDDEPSRRSLPHAHERDNVVYTGTHDNDTTRAWFAELPAASGGIGPRERAQRYMATHGDEMHWDLIRLAHRSPANTAIVPVQDLLGLGQEGRMNVPGTAEHNWEWRLRRGALHAGIGSRLRDLTHTYERAAAKETR
ncbi:MAG: 4-alpha-glucanotransferase [Phycisphaerae bacterium]